LNVIASGLSLESLALLSIAVAARVSVALLIGGELLGDRRLLQDLWLLPFRDLIALALWAWCYAGTTVQWRGRNFKVKNGKMLMQPTERA
jgi:ceramide glucosyltransferase